MFHWFINTFYDPTKVLGRQFITYVSDVIRIPAALQRVVRFNKMTVNLNLTRRHPLKVKLSVDYKCNSPEVHNSQIKGSLFRYLSISPSVQLNNFVYSKHAPLVVKVVAAQRERRNAQQLQSS